MNKEKFKSIILEGLDRDKRFLAVKIKNEKDFNPRVVIIQKEDIAPTGNRYLKLTDNEMIFKDTGDQIIDALMTSNLDVLNWFAY